MPDFPTGLPDIPAANGAAPLLTMHTSDSHAGGMNRAITNILALATKLGISSSTPAANTVLRGTGTGTSAYGQIVSADIQDGTITSLDLSAGTLGQAPGVAIGPSTDSAWADTAWHDVPQLTQTLTNVAANSILLFSFSIAAYHSVAGTNTTGQISLRIYCTTTAAQMGWWSPQVGHPTASLRMGHHLVVMVPAPTTGTVTFTAQIQAVNAGTVYVYTNTGAFHAAQIRTGSA